MSNLFSVLFVLLVAIAQVTVAPLFPLGAAVADYGLIAVAAVALVAGPRAAIVAIPLLALFRSFLGNDAPALMLLAYVPLLPVAFLADEAQLPLTRYLRLGLVVLAGGLWIRGLQAGAALVTGAEFVPRVLVLDLLLPGMVFDAALFSLLFGLLKLAKIANRPLTLERRGWAF